MRLFRYIKVQIDVNIQGIYKLVLTGNKVLQKKHFERKIIKKNMKIFIGFTSLYTELPGLTMLYFFLLVTSMTRFGTYPVIHMQSTDMVKVSTAIAGRIKRLMIQMLSIS